jgi:inosine/xanthosine triphosphate pyrophosphatase family protein
MRSFIQLKGGKAEEVKGEIVREQPLVIYVNGQKFVTLHGTYAELDSNRKNLRSHRKRVLDEFQAWLGNFLKSLDS